MPKQHYHMAATKVVFVDPEDGKASELDFNVMLRTDSRNVNANNMAKIQQNAQALFFKKVGTTYNVVDVFIYGVSYLGHMSEHEFSYKPEADEATKAAVAEALAPTGADGPFN